MTKENDFWKSFELDIGQTGYWKIGPLKIWITRFTNELQLNTFPSNDLKDGSIEFELPFTNEIPEVAEKHRYALKNTDSKITFSPRLSDRHMVVRPEDPFSLPENQEATIYIASTLWIKVEFGTDKTTLVELPIYRPSDTWFGATPASGELCYAARTKAKLRLEDIKQFSYRAISKVVIKNMTKKDLFLVRIKVPMMCLNLYQSKNKQFLTDTLIFEREKTQEQIKVKPVKPSIKEFGEVKKIASSLKPLDNGLVSRALNTLLG